MARLGEVVTVVSSVREIVRPARFSGIEFPESVLPPASRVPEMEQLPTLDQGRPASPPADVSLFSSGNITAAAVKRALEPMRFPGEDAGKSLGEMAQRDLDAALKLLVDRAQYITGASGGAIALEENGAMICRATSGGCAPQRGSRLQVNSGLTGECVRMKQILRCDNAATDARVNLESCRSVGIVSVLVAPLVRDEKVIGVFELFADRTAAFEERDTVAVQRLGEMIQTAVAHAHAATRVEQRAFGEESNSAEAKSASQVPPNPHEQVAKEQTATTPQPQITPPKSSQAASNITESAAGHIAQQVSIHKCQSCGFPVSEGRKLCVECQEKEARGELSAVPAFLAQYGEREKSSGWLRANAYWIGMVLISAATAAVLVWLR